MNRRAAHLAAVLVPLSMPRRCRSAQSTPRRFRAACSCSRDVGKRFAADAQRVYLTGHSGGARVAMEVALGPNDIAGVIASSAGFPDGKPRGAVRFPVFATAGIDDFNYLEMRRLDERLSSPHMLAVFDGGHTLPPDAVAMEAIEWMELQAMQSGGRQKDVALEARLSNADARAAALSRLTGLFEDWSRAAAAQNPSPTRSRARRLLGAVAAGASSRVKDQEYLALVRRYRVGSAPVQNR